MTVVRLACHPSSLLFLSSQCLFLCHPSALFLSSQCVTLGSNFLCKIIIFIYLQIDTI
ncbi:MAG: hypothetical protein ACR5K5_01055 [Wolbachia sp.]